MSRCKDPQERQFYILATKKMGWSKDVLIHKVELKTYEKSLKKQAIFLEKPWAFIDEDGAIQKLIFKKDKGLIISKNGKVIEGKWDYFPEAKSLLIDSVIIKV